LEPVKGGSDSKQVPSGGFTIRPVGDRSTQSSASGIAELGEEPTRSGIRFGVLGPLEAIGEAGPIELGGPKQRMVLAHLIVRANQVVPSDALIDLVWGEAPPDVVRTSLQSYVSNLRKALGPERLEGRIPGYILHLDPNELDAARFEARVHEAREGGKPPELVASRLREAMGLWRGPPFADLASEESLAGEIARLNDLHLRALEERIDADIALGRHVEVLGELEALTHEHVLRERLWGYLILALYRSGRQADALAAYQRLRAVLAQELGIDPSRELQELHQKVLRQDGSLELRGEELRGYRLIEKLGDGAFGVVYRAIQPQVEREVAVKSIHAEFANQPDFVRRFEREAQLVARLEHPRIVPLYDYWREPDAAYLIMRFLRGGSLEDLLDDGPLELEHAALILDQLGEALAAAHHQGVVHRDVKPGNVLLDEAGNAYLSDFGIALETGAPEQTAGAMIRGTPAYLSPEQIKLERTTPRSDIYALGVVLYEMLTGEHPFPGTSVNVLLDQHLHQPLPSVRERRPEIPPAVDATIARATAKDPVERFSDALELATAFRSAVEGTGVRTARAGEIRNPYKGLRAFLEADSADFFGRELLTRRLVERLAQNGAPRFLCVVGPSGSGKSSVVRAGLVPALRRGVIPGSERWYVVDLLPGAQPLRELETALLSVAVDPPPSLLDELERDELGLARVVDRLLPDPDAELLIVIDQLEEIFTMVDSEAERMHVLETIRATVSDPASRVRIVATLRADFYDQPLSIRGFGELLSARNEAITPMSPEELERAIVGPAEQVGLDVEPGLVAAMVADVIDRPGALPLLQYALTELADREDVGSLTLNAYRRVGGVSGALARRAERLFDAQDDSGRAACRRVFLSLVTLGEGSEDTRRRVRRAELGSPADARATNGVIESFGRHRLLSFDRDPASREPTVEIAHEALLPAWARLRGWIDEARGDIRTQRQVATAATEWVAAGEDESFLLRGSRLEQTAEWAATSSVPRSPADDRFLRASLARREDELARERARGASEAATQRRSKNRLRTLVVVFAVAALVAGSLTLIARNQSRRAERESRIATARELAAAAAANLEVDPERSILLALEAVRTTRSANGSVLPEAVEALHRAVGESRVVTRLNVQAADVEFSPDGSRLATAGNPNALFGPGATETEDVAFVWDATTGRRVLTLSGHRGSLWEVHFSPDGSRLATASADGTAAIWDAGTGERLFVLEHSQDLATTSFNSGGTKLLTTDLGGAVRLWDARDGALEREFPPGEMCGGWLSPDGGLIAGEACEALGTGVVLEAETGDRVSTLEGHTDALLDLAFSPGGSTIATTSVDGTAKVWEAATGKELLTMAGHGGWVFGVDFSPDGRFLATAGEDGTARVWDVATGDQRLVLSGHTGLIRDVAYSPDGSRLVTSSGDGTVRVWDVSPQGAPEQTILSRGDAVTNVAYSANGGVLATADRRVVLWDVSTGRKVLTLPRPTVGFDAAFAPDGATLVTGGLSGAPRLWDTTSGESVRVLRGAESWIASFAFGPDGSLVAGGDEDGQVVLWEASTGRLVRALGKRTAGGAHLIIDLDFSRDGTLLAAASFDGTVKVWDVASGRSRLVLQAHPIAVSAAFSPDGRLLATSGTDGAVQLWNVSTGVKIRSLAGHLGTVIRVAFSPGGETLATAGYDSTTRLWDVSTGEELYVLKGQTRGLTDLEFSPDGTRLATSANDGTVRVYVLPLQELVDLARSRLTRSWTEEECRKYLHLEACP
jgi:WD40 repeat protein/DNA-binding SARP family transcriptional activator